MPSLTLVFRRVMKSPVKVVRVVERVYTVLNIIRRARNHGFPVVSSDFEDGEDDALSEDGEKHFGRLEGFISKNYLIVLLHRKVRCC